MYHRVCQYVKTSGWRLMDGYQGRVTSTLPKSNSSPLKMGLPERKAVSQPSIFRGYVSFRDCRCKNEKYKSVG